jgi:hypothetical protein
LQGDGISNRNLASKLIENRQIVDDDFLHALRIYRDRDSKAVRLQASVLRGEMKRFVDCEETNLESRLY